MPTKYLLDSAKAIINKSRLNQYSLMIILTKAATTTKSGKILVSKKLKPILKMFSLQIMPLKTTWIVKFMTMSLETLVRIRKSFTLLSNKWWIKISQRLLSPPHKLMILRLSMNKLTQIGLCDRVVLVINHNLKSTRSLSRWYHSIQVCLIELNQDQWLIIVTKSVVKSMTYPSNKMTMVVELQIAN